MRIVRYLAQDGTIRHAAEQKNGICLDILGDLFHTFEVTDKEAKMVKLLSPIDPRVILGIGLNYRGHAIGARDTAPGTPAGFHKSAKQSLESRGPDRDPHPSPQYRSRLRRRIGRRDRPRL